MKSSKRIKNKGYTTVHIISINIIQTNKYNIKNSNDTMIVQQKNKKTKKNNNNNNNILKKCE
jgi:hypothetical protein